jgi:hypothetical protein
MPSGIPNAATGGIYSLSMKKGYSARKEVWLSAQQGRGCEIQGTCILFYNI